MAGTARIGVPRCFRINNGGNFLSQDSIDIYSDVSIHRKYSAPNTPTHNVVAESAICRAIKTGDAA